MEKLEILLSHLKEIEDDLYTTRSKIYSLIKNIEREITKDKLIPPLNDEEKHIIDHEEFGRVKGIKAYRIRTGLDLGKCVQVVREYEEN